MQGKTLGRITHLEIYSSHKNAIGDDSAIAGGVMGWGTGTWGHRTRRRGAGFSLVAAEL